MSSRYHWYDLILLCLAGMIIYPDKVLIWLGAQRGRPFARWQVILVEPIAIGLLVVTMLLLMPIYPRLDWWDSLIYVGALGLARFIYWFGEAFVRNLFDV